ncbi:hypothetical protein HPB52_008188 [Rhipicephalus sanguineus]|uniref:Uncharacterized protein n=1 Tax=Rhipicephalus sanguineus TaxID=34632 RepID=A0A9D4PVC8_RHISA|nr:hypothetical protein HPB52_008188 [Rhipicephalus sanguineus]
MQRLQLQQLPSTALTGTDCHPRKRLLNPDSRDGIRGQGLHLLRIRIQCLALEWNGTRLCATDSSQTEVHFEAYSCGKEPLRQAVKVLVTLSAQPSRAPRLQRGALPKLTASKAFHETFLQIKTLRKDSRHTQLLADLNRRVNYIFS